ncbi:MAG: hypothetical protein IPL06_03645 [Betaproteobacteria bacterium]|nr:hypothetical protein [Betaproteobacteria bacterium]
MGAPIRTRDVPARRGPGWLVDGWTFFRGRPLVWMGMGAGWIVITLGLLMVPIIGGIAANVLQPVFFASFAIAARKQENGETIEMGELFAGFRRPLMPLANLGAILLLAELAIFALLALLGLPGLTADAEGTVSMADFVREMQGKEWILLVGLVLTAIVKGALWFAPAVLAFHDMNTAHAIRWSLYAALSNLGAMVLYGLVLTVAMAAAILPWGLGLMVVIPVMVASTYVGYKDVFEQIDGDSEVTPA